MAPKVEIIVSKPAKTEPELVSVETIPSLESTPSVEPVVQNGWDLPTHANAVRYIGKGMRLLASEFCVQIARLVFETGTAAQRAQILTRNRTVKERTLKTLTAQLMRSFDCDTAVYAMAYGARVKGTEVNALVNLLSKDDAIPAVWGNPDHIEPRKTFKGTTSLRQLALICINLTAA